MPRDMKNKNDKECSFISCTNIIPAGSHISQKYCDHCKKNLTAGEVHMKNKKETKFLAKLQILENMVSENSGHIHKITRQNRASGRTRFFC